MLLLSRLIGSDDNLICYGSIPTMNNWYKEGLRFECQGSGKCCSSRGGYGFVYLTDNDIKKMAEHLNMTQADFKEQYCQFETESQFYHLKHGTDPDCLFLKKNKCNIYEARPVQCKTWPFWPETMNYKTWTNEVETFCPGVNKGKLYSKEEIDNIVQMQKESEQ